VGVARRRVGLIRHRDFRRLWAGDSISQLGSQVSELAIPLVAVISLHASTFEVGVLATLGSAAFLLIGLPAGAWCDRVRRRPVMIASDLVRAGLLASIPIAAALGILTIAQLFAVVLLLGLATVFFDVSYQSYLPSLVGRGALVEGNAKLAASGSVARVAGPAIGGTLVQLFTAPVALVADAVSFVASATCVGAIRTPEPAPPRPTQRDLRREIGEGLGFVLRHPILRAIAGTTGAHNLSHSAFGAVFLVFLVRDVHAGAGVIGALFSAASVGGALGALSAGWLARKIGHARAVWLPLLATSPLMLLVPLTRPGVGLALFAAGMLAHAYGGVVYNVAQASFRQALCPLHLLGRMNATMRFLVWGTMPIGGLLGGALGVALGLRATLWVTALGIALAGTGLLASPRRQMRDLPAADAAASP
jgi:MFS family permease